MCPEHLAPIRAGFEQSGARIMTANIGGEGPPTDEAVLKRTLVIWNDGPSIPLAPDDDPGPAAFAVPDTGVTVE